MFPDPPFFPSYEPPVPPGTTPVADRKQAAPLTKVINKMLPKRLMVARPRGRRIQSDQNVHIKHKNKVKYW